MIVPRYYCQHCRKYKRWYQVSFGAVERCNTCKGKVLDIKEHLPVYLDKLERSIPIADVTRKL